MKRLLLAMGFCLVAGMAQVAWAQLPPIGTPSTPLGNNISQGSGDTIIFGNPNGPLIDPFTGLAYVPPVTVPVTGGGTGTGGGGTGGGTGGTGGGGTGNGGAGNGPTSSGNQAPVGQGSMFNGPGSPLPPIQNGPDNTIIIGGGNGPFIDPFTGQEVPNPFGGGAGGGGTGGGGTGGGGNGGGTGGGSGGSGGTTPLPPPGTIGSNFFPGGSFMPAGVLVNPVYPLPVFLGTTDPNGGLLVTGGPFTLTNNTISGNSSMGVTMAPTDPWPQLTMLITGDPVAAQQFQNRATQLFGPVSGGYTTSNIIPDFNGSVTAMNTFFNDVVSETNIAKSPPTIVSTTVQSNQDNNP